LRIEVDAQLVGVVGVAGARRPRMEHDGVHLRGPHRCGGLIEHELRMPPAARVGDRDRPHPLGSALRRVLREELLAVDALGEPLERHGTIAVRLDERVAHRHEVFGELELGDTGLGPEHPRR
jgi:hypothetical protein